MVRSFYSILFLFCGFYCLGQVEFDFPKKSEAELEQVRSDKLKDINGLWEGSISQSNWNGQPEFAGVSGKLHVELKQRGKKVDGLLVVRAKFANDMGYLSYEKTFTGIWDGQTLTYKDIAIDNYINTHKRLRHLETCMKEATLTFYELSNSYNLEGNWEGVGHVSDIRCVPGTIRLTKVKEESLAIEEATAINVNFNKNTDGGPVFIKWGKDDKIKKIKDRKVEEGKLITVESRRISITVYDHKKNDGDIISLNYNGEWILEKYRLVNDEHQIDLTLKNGVNAPDYLILYAHNLGQFPPNTCAIIVDDGQTRQRYILNADMNTSDVLYFESK